MAARKFLSFLMASTLPLFGAFEAAAAPEPELFGQLPQAHDAAISPDGRKIAILQNYEGEYVVNILDLKTLKADEDLVPKAVWLAEGVKPDFLKWTSDDRVLVSVWQSQKYGNTPINTGYLYKIDIDDMDVDLLVEPGNDRWFRQFNNRVVDWLEDDPDHIMMQFAGMGTDQSEPDVRKVRLENGADKLIRSASSGINHWITDASGEPRVGIGYKNRGRDEVMRIVDPETGKWKNYDHFPGLDPEFMSVTAVIDEGRSLVLRAYRGSDTLGLHRYDLVKKSFAETLYQNDEYDVGGVILSKDGESIVGASFTGESQERVLFDEYDSTFEEALARFDGFTVQFVDQSHEGDQLLLRVSGPSEPGYLYLYEKGGTAIPLISNRKGLSAEQMGEVISVRYTARDGEKIPAFITVPVTFSGKLENLPFIILPHGGPFARDTKNFDWLAQFFANEGYAVLQMNFRGSDGYGKSFSDAGRDSWVVMQEDVEDGMRWLLDKGYADPDRTCIAGWSYGGYAALMGAATHPDLYKCAVAIAALTDIPEAVSDARKYTGGRGRAERTFGALMDNKDLLRANNPVDRAKDIKVPVFMAHGRLDSSVEYDQFIKMRRKLKDAGVKGTYLGFEEEDHYMSSQENRQAMLEGIAAFLDQVNGESPYAP